MSYKEECRDFKKALMATIVALMENKFEVDLIGCHHFLVPDENIMFEKMPFDKLAWCFPSQTGGRTLCVKGHGFILSLDYLPVETICAIADELIAEQEKLQYMAIL